MACPTYARITKFNQLTIPSVSKDTKQRTLWQKCKSEQLFRKTVALSAMTPLSPNDSALY